MKKKVCIITGTRSEYGLLKPLIDEFKSDSFFNVQIIATGMHLSPEFGLTYKEIERDGLKIDEKVEILLSSDTPIGVSKAMGLGMISFSEAYERLKPDLLIGLGDRFELFAGVIAAMICGIPVAHLYGGEATEGVVDESIRHAITKMSHIHFTSTEEYRRRVIQLGEDPDRVFNVGAIGLENIKKLKLLDKRTLEKELKFKFGDRNMIVTYHPVTLERLKTEKQFNELLNALDEFKEINVIFTKANADAEGRVINFLIDKYVENNKNRARSFVSLGRLKYLSTLKFVDVMVGNSSSGIIEMPSFGNATINIGDRQRGRIKAKSVIDCRPRKKDIVNAVNRVFSEGFKKKLNMIKNPYYKKGTAARIKDILKKIDLEDILKKEFFDLNF